MKAAIEICCLLAASVAFGDFDSTEWMARRSLLEQEALRLRKAYSNCVSRVTEPALDITIPLETFPDGSVKSAVSVKKAVFFMESGLVWGEDVCVRKHDSDGRVVSQIDARHCVLDRLTKSGWAEGPARVRHGNTVFDGEGIYFSSPEGYVMTMSKTRIVSKDLKFGGLQ